MAITVFVRANTISEVSLFGNLWSLLSPCLGSPMRCRNHYSISVLVHIPKGQHSGQTQPRSSFFFQCRSLS